MGRQAPASPACLDNATVLAYTKRENRREKMDYGFLMTFIQVFCGRGNPRGCPLRGRHEACPYAARESHQP
jgi:hypothetical protein